MGEDLQIACNQEYYIAKIYGCNDFRRKIDGFGMEVGKKIVALKSDTDGMLTFSVEGCKRNCTFPKSYLSNLSLVSASECAADATWGSFSDRIYRIYRIVWGDRIGGVVAPHTLFSKSC